MGILTLIFTLGLLAFGDVNGQGNLTIEGTNICDKENTTSGCECIVDTHPAPVPILCDGLGLHAMYEQSDWLATFDQMNITENMTLDIRFDNNDLIELPRFPPMAVVTLYFRFNKISYIEPKAFSELKQLNSLDLSHNNLTSGSLNEGVFMGQYNDTLGYFPLGLTHLNLSHNRIHSLDKNAFDHLPLLKSLDLSYNPLKVLSGSTSMAISHLKKLEYLGLARTKVNTMHEGMLHDLIVLTSLDLSGNEFVKVPQELRFTHKLQVLILDKNKFETLDRTSFVGLNELKDLSLRGNERLKSVEEGTFAELRNLTKLDLSYCKRLEALSDGAFEGMVDKNNTSEWKLTYIRLNDNGLAQVDQVLAPWDLVDYIDIRNNPFRCDCNLEWMIDTLMPKIEKIKPGLTTEMHCAQPKAMKGKSLVNLMLEPNLFSRCRDSKDELFPDEISLIPSGSYRAAGITILIIGVLLIIIGGFGIVFIIVKRRAITKALAAHQEIRYERADSDDDGIGSMNSSKHRKF